MGQLRSGAVAPQAQGRFAQVESDPVRKARAPAKIFARSF